MDEKFAQYFINDTNSKILELKTEFREEIGKVNDQLTDLRKFKIEMLASARTSAFLISAICGGVTLVCAVLTVIILNKPNH